MNYNYSYHKKHLNYLEESVSSFRNIYVLTDIANDKKENIFPFSTYNVHGPDKLNELCGIRRQSFYNAVSVYSSNKCAYCDVMNSSDFYNCETIICNINGYNDPEYKKLLASNDTQVSFYTFNGYKNLMIIKENKALSEYEYAVEEYYLPISFDMSLFLTKLRLYKHMKGIK